MSTLQQQAKALGDPTRHRVFRYVVDAAQPVDVAELTDHFGLNHNAIRQHLAKLVDAGLVLEDKAAPAGRGRPRLVYLVGPAVEGRWGATGPYEELSIWLTEVIRSGAEPVEVGRRAGRETPGAPAGVHRQADPVGVLVDSMARHGFDPTVRVRGAKVDVTLRSCPFEAAALVAPEIVCDIHLGIAQGVAEGIDGLVVDELVPNDARRAHCVLRCHLDPEAGARPSRSQHGCCA